VPISIRFSKIFASAVNVGLLILLFTTTPPPKYRSYD
jgi:hypothetical protein